MSSNNPHESGIFPARSGQPSEITGTDSFHDSYDEDSVSGYAPRQSNDENSTNIPSSGQESTEILLPGRFLQQETNNTTQPQSTLNPLHEHLHIPYNLSELSEPHKKLINSIRTINLNDSNWYKTITSARPLSAFEVDVIGLKPRFLSDEARGNHLTTFERDVIACEIQRSISPRKGGIRSLYPINSTQMSLLKVLKEWDDENKAGSHRPSFLNKLGFGRRIHDNKNSIKGASSVSSRREG